MTKSVFGNFFLTSLLVLGLVILISPAISAFALGKIEPYVPGQTLDPDCLPGESNCTVIDLINSTSSNTYLALNGNLGVGTSTPLEKLQVIGNILASGILNAYNFSGTSTGVNTGDFSLNSASSTGLSLDGQVLSISSDYNIPLTASTSDWNTAFGWGNHSTAGYLSTTSASLSYYPLSNPSNYISSSVSNLTNYPTYTYASSTFMTYGYASSTYASTSALAYYLSTTSAASTYLSIANSTTTVRNLFSSTATGLSYATSTGIFSLTSGYNIPLTASSTNWNTAYSWGNHATAGYLSTTSAASTYLTQINADLIYLNLTSGTTTPGYILQTTATGTQWVSTSTLGISGGSQTPWVSDINGGGYKLTNAIIDGGTTTLSNNLLIQGMVAEGFEPTGVYYKESELVHGRPAYSKSGVGTYPRIAGTPDLGPPWVWKYYMSYNGGVPDLYSTEDVATPDLVSTWYSTGRVTQNGTITSASPTKVAVTIKLKRATASNWLAANPVLAQGERGLVIDETGKTISEKIGDGVTTWINLDYFGG
ncbi:MAG: hypothetical protein WCO30_01555, partial [bacterium]